MAVSSDPDKKKETHHDKWKNGFYIEWMKRRRKTEFKNNIHAVFVFFRLGVQLEILCNKSAICQVHGLLNRIYRCSSCQWNWPPWNRRLVCFLHWTWIAQCAHLSALLHYSWCGFLIDQSPFNDRLSMWRATRKIYVYHTIITVCSFTDWSVHSKNFARFFWAITHRSDPFGRTCWTSGVCVMNQMYCSSNTRIWKRI